MDFGKNKTPIDVIFVVLISEIFILVLMINFIKIVMMIPRDLIFVSLPKIPDSSCFSKFFKVWMYSPDISAST